MEILQWLGGILLTPLFPIVLQLSLLPRSGTQIVEKQRKKRNESQGENGVQRELRTQKQGNSSACIFVIIHLFSNSQARFFFFWVSYPPDTRAKTQSPSNTVTSDYSVHTRSTIQWLTAHSKMERKRDGGMEPSISTHRSAKKRQMPKLAVGRAWHRMWPRKLSIGGTSGVLLFIVGNLANLVNLVI